MASWPSASGGQNNQSQFRTVNVQFVGIIHFWRQCGYSRLVPYQWDNKAFYCYSRLVPIDFKSSFHTFSSFFQTLTTARLSQGLRAPRLSQCHWARPWTKSWWTCHLPPPSWSVTAARTLALSATFSSRWPVLTHRFRLFFKDSFFLQVLQCLQMSSYLYFSRSYKTYMGCSVKISKI